MSAAGIDSMRIGLHGHAYQPPRADPRTGRVPVEASAEPFHDWNHRITAECYAPCTATRLHDATGRVTAIVNLFERMSFDLGPTLGHWLARFAPTVHQRIVAGDRAGRTAIAHPYHHIILPLAPAEDAMTELRWGMADFRHRFGRQPEGMWLPETAIDGAVFAMLADLGIAFTIVAPHQVERVPPPGTVGRVGRRGPQSPTLVVYDGPTSHDLAFGAALGSADALADRLVVGGGRSLGGDGTARLAVAATDLETFGHHHRFSERAVGHTLFEETVERGLVTGGLAGLLEGVERHDVGDVLLSAWSCAHGVERWRTDCGCSADGGKDSHQRWRAPVRAALDVLRDHAWDTFCRRGADVFDDPPAARDAYGDVLANPAVWDDFVSRHVRPMASEDEARVLLESQEATLASFTSCGWFFADLARREMAIVLGEAARSADLLTGLGESPPIDAALNLLDKAEGIAGRGPSGRAVWAWALDPAPADDDAGRTGSLGRWDAASPVENLVADLAAEAVQGSADASERALAVIDLARRAGDPSRFTTAQERVYDALVGRGRAAAPELVVLGEGLGLATAAVTAAEGYRWHA